MELELAGLVEHRKRLLAAVLLKWWSNPAKAQKTINKYLGKNYKVVASMGHVRDLPKSKLGVDVDEGFEPSYEVIASRKKVIKELKDAAKEADRHLRRDRPRSRRRGDRLAPAEELGSGNRKKIRRLMFNEITKKACSQALEHPREIDKKMVDAQQARRVLDRLVGYKISPLLWDKVRRGLSAGRVQSVALKLVCDREREIERSSPRSTGTSRAPRRDGAAGVRRQARSSATATRHQGRQRGRGATRSSPDLRGATWVVASVTTKERKRAPRRRRSSRASCSRRRAFRSRRR